MPDHKARYTVTITYPDDLDGQRVDEVCPFTTDLKRWIEGGARVENYRAFAVEVEREAPHA